MNPPPIFHFSRVTGSRPSLRPVAWSLATILTVATYVLLRRRVRRRAGDMPPRHPDRLVRLSGPERAVWEAFEDAAMDDVGLAILDREEDSR